MVKYHGIYFSEDKKGKSRSVWLQHDLDKSSTELAANGRQLFKQFKQSQLPQQSQQSQQQQQE